VLLVLKIAATLGNEQEARTPWSIQNALDLYNLGLAVVPAPKDNGKSMEGVVSSSGVSTGCQLQEVSADTPPDDNGHLEEVWRALMAPNPEAAAIQSTAMRSMIRPVTH